MLELTTYGDTPTVMLACFRTAIPQTLSVLTLSRRRMYGLVCSIHTCTYKAFAELVMSTI